MILSDIATFSRGNIVPTSKLKPGGYPVITGGAEIKQYTDRYNRIGETIAVSSSGSAGYVSFWDEPIFVTDAFTIEVDSDMADRKYIYFLLKSLQTQIMNKAKGSIIPHVYPKDVSTIKIPNSSLVAQRKIGRLLFGIDESIKNNCDQCDLLNKIIELIYSYWFVQFDFPDENGQPYKSSGGKMVYNDQLKQEIPEGWKVEGLMTIADWTSGAQPPKSQHVDHPGNGYIRFIQNRDYSDDKNVRYIPESKANKLCNEYDIMVDKYGDAGRTRFGLKGAFNVALAKITPTIPNMREYLRCYLSQQSVYRHLHESCMMSTRASLNAASLAQLSIIVPPQAILQRFESLSKRCIELVLINKEQSKQLASLRDWLLPTLMNGQIKIKDEQQE